MNKSIVTGFGEQSLDSPSSDNHQSQITSNLALVTTRSVEGCGVTALFKGLFTVGLADHTENKG